MLIEKVRLESQQATENYSIIKRFSSRLVCISMNICMYLFVTSDEGRKREREAVEKVYSEASGLREQVDRLTVELNQQQLLLSQTVRVLVATTRTI